MIIRQVVLNCVNQDIQNSVEIKNETILDSYLLYNSIQFKDLKLYSHLPCLDCFNRTIVYFGRKFGTFREV